jgi:hypothetical protein
LTPSRFDAIAARNMVHKICALSDDALERVIATAHPSWVAGIDLKPTIEVWKNRQAAILNKALDCLP